MAIYELDGTTPEFPADGLYWIADTASVIGKDVPYALLAAFADAVDLRPRLNELSCPVLVLHGTVGSGRSSKSTVSGPERAVAPSAIHVPAQNTTPPRS